MDTKRRLGASDGCAVRVGGLAQIVPFWVPGPAGSCVVIGLWNGLACHLAFGVPVPGLGCHARRRPCQDLGGAATGRDGLALGCAATARSTALAGLPR